MRADTDRVATTSDLAVSLRDTPISLWPADAFEALGLLNPFTTGKLTQWRKVLHASRHLTGSVVECGTYRGGGTLLLALLMREDGDARAIYSFDSFMGLPQPGPHDHADGRYKGRPPAYFADTEYAEVQKRLHLFGVADRVTLVGGFFAETLPLARVTSVSVMILDCNLYESYQVCLRELYPLVQRGGWMVFDEYFSPRYPGARRAVDEFFADKSEKPQRDEELLESDAFERWFAVKA
jgi:predicted O-methyltransferase YrrM